MILNFRFPLASLAVGIAFGLVANTWLLITSHAADAPAVQSSLPDDEALALEAVKIAGVPGPPAKAGRTERLTQAEYEAWAAKEADHRTQGAAAAAEFLTKFPNSLHVPEVRYLQVLGLSAAGLLSPSPERESEFSKNMNLALADKSLPQTNRFQLRELKLRRDVTRAARGFGGDPVTVQSEGLLALQQDFPTNPKVYDMMLGYAVNEKADNTLKFAKIIAASPYAPEKSKSKAQTIVDGNNFVAAKHIGLPISLKFTAVDGRAVDLATLKGKVVLVDFWATWCGPCVAEIPHVKEAYAKYHDQGFEVIGISFDRAGDKDKLINFTKAKDMPWPQYFNDTDGDNKYAEQFNVSAIPVMWLIGKDGRLADIEARGNLTEKVAKLLAVQEASLSPSGNTSQAGPATPPAISTPTIKLLSEGAVAPGFIAKDLAGKEVQLADFKGHVVVLDFWATWCGPCVAGLSQAEAVAKTYQDQGVIVLAHCSSDTWIHYADWMKTNQVKYPNLVLTCDLHDQGSANYAERIAKKLYGVSNLPTQFIIDREGKIAAVLTGYTEGELCLEAGLARAGIKVDPMIAAKGEEQIKKREAGRLADAENPAADPRLAKLNPAAPPRTGQLINDRAVAKYLENEGRKLLDNGRLMSNWSQSLDYKKAPIKLADPSTNKLTLEKVIAQIEPSVVALGTFYNCGKCANVHISTASGFFVTEAGAIVTCRHVLASFATNGLGVVALTRDGQVLPVRAILACDPAQDTIVLQVEGHGFKPMPLAGNDALPGSAVVVVAHPKGHFYVPTTGIAARQSEEIHLEGRCRTLSITADFAAGSSGGPVCDETGAVVGIVDNTQSIYYNTEAGEQKNFQMSVKNCSPVSTLRKLLE